MNKYRIIQIASHLGEHKDGVETGPEKIVSQFASSHVFEHTFDSHIVSIAHVDPDPELEVGEFEKLKHLPQITESYELENKAIGEAINQGFVPVSIIGSDEVAAPIFNAVAANFNREDIGIVWIDSHPDLNDASTTPSGNIHGMSLALAFGHGDPRLLTTRPENGFEPRDAVLVGPGNADIDAGETAFIAKHGMLHFAPDLIREKGSAQVVVEITNYFNKMGKTKLAIHFDLDSIDPAESPGVSVPARDGNTFAEVYGITKGLLTQFELASFNLAEYNPTKDPNGVTLHYALEVLELLK